MLKFFQSQFIRYAVIPLLLIWLIWFGLSKYFYTQDTKEFDIPNPIQAVPADSEYYSQKRLVKSGPWSMTTDVFYGRVQHHLVSYVPLNWTIVGQYPQKFYEKLFYKPKPFIDGGLFQNSIYSSALEGLKYCRIHFKPDSYSGMVNKQRMQFSFLPSETPCIQHEDYGGRGEMPALVFSKDAHVFYLDFWGYLQSHVNNYNDIKDYVYRCEITSDQKVQCKLLGYDNDAELLKEEASARAKKNGSLVPLHLWN